MEPILRDIVGDSPNDPGPNSLPDPVGDFLHETEFGTPRPRDANAPLTKTPVPLTRAEIATALQNLSKVLGRPDFRNTHELVAKLAKAAESHLEEGDPIRGWLIAYSQGDKQTMRASIKALVTKSRDEIIRHVAKGGHPLELLVRDDERPN